jgi:16S rRNA (cytidine1402-2'-O)-methyltransferase
MLYIVSTPIGNLKDITLRALEVLRSCDYLLCEDTRVSEVLLRHYDLHKTMVSLHKFNEARIQERVLNDLKNGQNIALISDAGTPAISDPGEKLVQACVQEQITVFPIPGPTSVIAALSASGLPTLPFQFIGFLPRTAQEKRMILLQSLLYEGTTIAFESPERVQDTLQLLHIMHSSRQVVIAREITKYYETFYRGTVSEILLTIGDQTLKGEVVLLIGPDSRFKETLWKDVPIQDLVMRLEQEFGLMKKEAIKAASLLTGFEKRNLYRFFIDPK